MSDVRVERERDFDRFLTFVDAIVAIAITLLVLPLVDAAGAYRGDSVTRLLSDSNSQIWAFFLSFVVIADLWLTQHRLFHNVVLSNSAIQRLMLLWTLTIVCLPFPTALVAGNTGHEPVTKTLYVGTMAVSALVLALLCLVIGRHPELRDSAETPDHVLAFATFAAFVVALVMMLVLPGVSYWPLLVLLVPDRLVRLWRGRGHPRQEA
jgi:uncharacterized membrane protein